MHIGNSMQDMQYEPRVLHFSAFGNAYCSDTLQRIVVWYPSTSSTQKRICEEYTICGTFHPDTQNTARQHWYLIDQPVLIQNTFLINLQQESNHLQQIE